MGVVAWAISKKFAAAIGTGMALPILASYGYQVNLAQVNNTAATIVNSPQALQMLSFLYAGVPCLCNFISIIILSQYRLNKEDSLKIRSELDSVK